jgi:hypothetical protein
MRILLLLIKGYSHLEAAPFIDVFGRACDKMGIDAETVICGLHGHAYGAFDVPLIVDKLIDDVDPEDYDALALPGGLQSFGYLQNADDERVRYLVRDFAAAGKPIAATSLATEILECIEIDETAFLPGQAIRCSSPAQTLLIALKLFETLSSQDARKTLETLLGYQQ